MSTATTTLNTTDTTRRMVGIVTTYSGPTDYKGSKIIAKWADLHNGKPSTPGSIFFDYRDDLDSGDNHYAAASALLATSGRDEHWTITGRIDNSHKGFMFVLDYIA